MTCCCCNKEVPYRRRDYICDECREGLAKKEQFSWEAPFKPEDFSMGSIEIESLIKTPILTTRDAVMLANRRFREIIAQGKRVTGRYEQGIWFESPLFESPLYDKMPGLDTHTAILICEKEIE